MNYPGQDDYIDIHTHGSAPEPGVFMVETLMAHEEKTPVELPGITYIAGIHPWHLNEDNYERQISYVERYAGHDTVAAIGEAGFDRLRGASPDLQRKVFREQAAIAGEHGKPMVIHCVRAWDELLQERKLLRPSLPWLVHGFRGKPALAGQLIEKGIYLSFWFEFIMKPESRDLIRSLPSGRIFLETDGADIDIRDIYKKVSTDMEIAEDKLKAIIYSNFHEFFKLNRYSA
ncbi:MAG TPA: TatD family hydrolase [Bacteroidales bacterium]|nr:TatD family hydrolase [Bacteroidales bacterium]HPF01722.1 TatD family hydrolase [Bacteroidales bacterium]HPJ59758.1 TatD family hydrolase [Bacteroidales bacterium]HPR11798.1 TatD family hydrolase [Bacteroidales bacterium]HRW84053.1 TatD family hydrolase [Bacteroidales bacterium]